MTLRNMCLILGFTFSSALVHGQATQNSSDQVAASIAKVKSGDFNGSHVEVIAKAGAVDAIPALEEQFRHKTDASEKEEIASALVRLGDKDNTYWNYLEEQAGLAVDSDIPDAVFSESQGKWLEHAPSPELQAWADAHHVDANTAGIESIYGFPGKLLFLGETGDARGIPVLRRALQSRDYPIVMAASKGLAQIQDKDSIPLIIAACQRAPTGYNSAIAMSLIWFDDPRAQAAVDTYVPKPYAQATRELRAQGRKPLD
jgi:PBS lyase HEAT-like repeat